METPLDKVPPARGGSVAPLGGVGSVLAGGAGGVAVIGIAGSTFRLLENICIWLGLLPKDHGTVIHKGQPSVWKDGINRGLESASHRAGWGTEGHPSSRAERSGVEGPVEER